MEDVIAIKPGKEAGPVAPRPPSASSIPGMCVLFQNEWDALMLETFELKKQLDQVGFRRRLIVVNDGGMILFRKYSI